MKKIIATISFLLSLNAMAWFDCDLGEIKGFVGHYAPRNWMVANGALLRISDHADLYSVIGNYYGGDGKTTFALPDLSGRAAVGQGRLKPSGSDYYMGQKEGLESITLSSLNMPVTNVISKTKRMAVIDHIFALESDESEGVKVPLLAEVEDVASGTVSGSNLPIYSRSPYTVVNYVICVRGIYPNRP